MGRDHSSFLKMIAVQVRLAFIVFSTAPGQRHYPTALPISWRGILHPYHEMPHLSLWQPLMNQQLWPCGHTLPGHPQCQQNEFQPTCRSPSATHSMSRLMASGHTPLAVGPHGRRCASPAHHVLNCGGFASAFSGRSPRSQCTSFISLRHFQVPTYQMREYHAIVSLAERDVNTCLVMEQRPQVTGNRHVYMHIL
jgi:hypothetical protein